MESLLSWRDKYSLCLNDNLSIKDIMKLLDCGQPHATMLREKSIIYCENHNIQRIRNKVPTDVILQLVGKDREYFYRRMLDEKRLKEQDDRS